MRIDAHQHFWQYHPERDAWITEDMHVIRQDFMPNDLKPILDEYAIDGCVVVQADQSEKETNFLLDIADNNSWVKGVVGWINLLDEGLKERLDYYRGFSLLKGVRHILQAEPDGFMTNPIFIKGVEEVGKLNLTYDILSREDQLSEVLELIKKLPEMKLVIDHISKPDIKNQSFDHWAGYMKQISTYDHVHVKLSGMVTETNWSSWTATEFQPYVDVCLENFKPERLMFGSDWPVSLLAGTYSQVINSLKECIEELSPAEQGQIMGKTAVKFYELI
ncbi:amidohydrolase family protein [Fulvivirga sp. M361]|uniref:amidohydrolase family protein n=1 Tax=Fulvivirga sp. M361 TaxID=2594266 RepID=UPI00117A7CD6|nr:amidohydrolase family protein [Fulvivirga sp. M361]TRX51896.1 amidohydrolase family protein [Fulvivirga sp. M361]